MRLLVSAALLTVLGCAASEFRERVVGGTVGGHREESQGRRWHQADPSFRDPRVW